MLIATTDHPTPVTLDVTDSAAALVDALGVGGVVTLLTLAAILLRSRRIRRYLSRRVRRAVRTALRAAWWALTAYVLILVRHGIVPTWEEQRVLRRLTARHWREHAAARGLGGTLPGRVRLTRSGIVAAVRLDGQWTPRKLRDAEGHIRALLGLRSERRIEVAAGTRGGWARLTVRTRTAVPAGTLPWDPAAPLFGLDTITGEEVVIPLGERLLIAGMSGAGKSVASRPLLYAASEDAGHALVIIDLKRVEGRLWDHRARVAADPDAVVAVVADLVAEMHERLHAMPKGMDRLTPTPDRPRITVVVDEGAEVSSAARDALAGLETLARMGRAAAVDVWWMTQKPTMSGQSAGIPPQVAPQLSTRICLAVSTPTEARVVLGEDAQQRGWTAESLPMPGVALVRDGSRPPHPVRVAYMTAEQVLDLPARPIWQRAAAAEETAPTAPALSLVKDHAAPDRTAGPAVPEQRTAVDLLLGVLADGRERTVAQLVTDTGRSQSQVYAALRSAVESGAVVKRARGRYAAAAGAGEVSA